MSTRRKNLLEAFKTSDAPAAPAQGAASSRDATSPSLFDAVGARLSSSPRARPRPTWALFALGVVVTFLLGYLAGRSTLGEARAEGPEAAPGGAPLSTSPRPPPSNQPRAFQPRSSAPAPVAAESGLGNAAERIEDSALFDARNAYTVVVAAYSNKNEDPAWATYEHLREESLAVFPPVASGNLLVVLVGAAPTEAALEATKSRVRGLLRDGKKAYEDAYLARIDKLIPRPSTKGNEKP